MGNIDNIKARIPVDELYKSRSCFSIIALTGISDTSCAELSKMMSDEDFMRDPGLRIPKDLPVDQLPIINNSEIYDNGDEGRYNKAVGKLIFKRKYTICYDFLSNEAQKETAYTVIKYNHVVWLYLLLFIYSIKNFTFNKHNLKSKILEILKEKFAPSHKEQVEKDYKKLKDYQSKEIIGEQFLDNFDIVPIVNLIQTIPTDFSFKKYFESQDNTLVEKIYDVFCHKDFKEFIEKMDGLLESCDILARERFYHRLSACIRSLGDPFYSSEKLSSEKNPDCTHLYDLVKMINKLIKGVRIGKNPEHKNESRIVIDSIKNSLEALYLKERYNAFYLMAVHDEGKYLDIIKAKVKRILKSKLNPQEEPNKNEVDLTSDAILRFKKKEADAKDFDRGIFFSPNVSQCIADAEIHIINRKDKNSEALSFYSTAEQWMKYKALILHPGLITPSSEERCMIVAYTAKFNSGCLSRQVGAVITNSSHSIRTIGWNDVPYGQIPCGLRSLTDYISPSPTSLQYTKYMYSAFEQSDEPHYDEDKTSLKSKIRYDYEDLKNSKHLEGLPTSYCFKSLENKYSDVKNQVHTRSLHAEENAMMQMVRNGGEKLKDGIIYVTASPCELCSKKLYQIGVRRIVYIDPYPGISRMQIVNCGYKRPELKLFEGVYGESYFKLYRPFMSYKDEFGIRFSAQKLHTASEILQEFTKKIKKGHKDTYTEDEYNEIKSIIENIKIEENKN